MTKTTITCDVCGEVIPPPLSERTYVRLEVILSVMNDSDRIMIDAHAKCVSAKVLEKLGLDAQLRAATLVDEQIRHAGRAESNDGG